LTLAKLTRAATACGNYNLDNFNGMDPWILSRHTSAILYFQPRSTKSNVTITYAAQSVKMKA
jgi:hypothetical protein